MTAAPDVQNRIIVDELRRALGDAIAVYRFGSSADGDTRHDSDTDFAILSRVRLPPTERFDPQERLAVRLGHDVDRVDLTAASTVMAMQVVAKGVLLYEGDATARGQFEDRTFSAYVRLNDERRGILERVAAEGTVSGREGSRRCSGKDDRSIGGHRDRQPLDLRNQRRRHRPAPDQHPHPGASHERADQARDGYIDDA